MPRSTERYDCFEDVNIDAANSILCMTTWCPKRDIHIGRDRKIYSSLLPPDRSLPPSLFFTALQRSTFPYAAVNDVIMIPFQMRDLLEQVKKVAIANNDIKLREIRSRLKDAVTSLTPDQAQTIFGSLRGNFIA